MLIFPTQYSLNQLNHTRMSQYESLVINESVYKARREGMFSPQNIQNLKSKVAQLYNISENEVIVNVTTTPKYRRDVFDDRELIKYEISVPIKNIIVGSSFFNLNAQGNSTMYTIKGAVESEVLAP